MSSNAINQLKIFLRPFLFYLVCYFRFVVFFFTRIYRYLFYLFYFSLFTRLLRFACYSIVSINYQFKCKNSFRVGWWRWMRDVTVIEKDESLINSSALCRHELCIAISSNLSGSASHLINTCAGGYECDSEVTAALLKWLNYLWCMMPRNCAYRFFSLYKTLSITKIKLSLLANTLKIYEFLSYITKIL